MRGGPRWLPVRPHLTPKAKGAPARQLSFDHFEQRLWRYLSGIVTAKALRPDVCSVADRECGPRTSPSAYPHHLKQHPDRTTSSRAIAAQVRQLLPDAQQPGVHLAVHAEGPRAGHGPGQDWRPDVHPAGRVRLLQVPVGRAGRAHVARHAARGCGAGVEGLCG